ncbi:hypothetical protein FQA39_LY16601 [Lamprigera yunnana]|nr:hypothetical protein FQA39_LY16601 [Lamprigera yunnana]
MKTTLTFVAVCIVVTSATAFINLSETGYYWKDWNVKEPISFDAVPGGIDKNGHKTFIAKSLFPKYCFQVPGQASKQDHIMRYEFEHKEHERTKEVLVLCSLNHRFHWVTGKDGDDVYTVGQR